MKTLKFTVLIEQDEDGVYIGSVPDIKGVTPMAKRWMNL